MDNDFLIKLASAAPTPGGGGAAALAGALSAALCSMVANLTSGKKKYAQFQGDIEDILQKSADLMTRLESLIDEDAAAFAPLAAAYGIARDDPGREDILQGALAGACAVPMEILRVAAGIPALLEDLAVKGSRLALSDVAVAASLCRSAMESAVLNVYINTKLMSDRDYARRLNLEAGDMLTASISRCEAVYAKVAADLRGDML